MLIFSQILTHYPHHTIKKKKKKNKEKYLNEVDKVLENLMCGAFGKWLVKLKNVSFLAKFLIKNNI